MTAPQIEIRFGNLIDTLGSAVEHGSWRFIPAIIELNGYDSGFEFARDPASRGLCFPQDADAAFIRARIPRAFGYTPQYDESNEKCLLWEGFVAVPCELSEGIPFICSDDYGSSKLYFSEAGPDTDQRQRIASAFWELMAQDPSSVDDFEQGIFHYSACTTIYFGCKDGEPYYREED